MNKLKQRISAILTGMCHGTFERKDVMALSVLSALSGESIFLLGLPNMDQALWAATFR